MPEIIIIIIAVISTIAAIGFLEMDRCASLACAIVAVALFTWFGYGATRAWRVDSSAYYSIETVTYGDGNREQFYRVGDGHESLTKKFHEYYPDGFKVRVDTRHLWYAGVYFGMSDETAAHVVGPVGK